MSYYLNFPAVWGLLHRGSTKILMYHGIPNRSSFEGVANTYGYNIPVQEFETHLQYLKRYCNVISLESLLAGQELSTGKMNIVLTFDDGYENNYSSAFKLLKEYELPAVFSLPTAFVFDRQPLWNDLVEFALNSSTKKSVSFSWNGYDVQFSLAKFDDRLSLYNWLMRQCVQTEQEQRDKLIQFVLEKLGVSATSKKVFENEDYRPLSKEQVKEMANSGLVEFASHSVHHYLLSKLSREEKRQELTTSKQLIDGLLGLRCKTFCVPGGAYDSEMVDEAIEAGYNRILTSDPGTANCNERVLNRNGVFHRQNIHWFADMVHGPVFEGVEATRKAKGAIRTIFKAGAAA